MADFNLDPEVLAEQYISEEFSIADSKAALDGAKFILMERFTEQADLLAQLRSIIADKGMLMSSVSKDKEQEGEKFRDYFDYREPISKVPPHRALALFRGRKESVLSLKLDIPDLGYADYHPCEAAIANTFETPYCPDGDFTNKPAASQWLTEVVRWTWRVKLLMQIENDLLGDLRDVAEAEAIKVFADNLKDVLLSSPAGQRATLLVSIPDCVRVSKWLSLIARVNMLMTPRFIRMCLKINGTSRYRYSSQASEKSIK